MKESVDPQTRQQMDAFYKKYDELFNKNDAAAVAALYTEDAVFVADTGIFYGREAIEKWYSDEFQKAPNRNNISKVDQKSPHVIGTAGDEVWSTGEWSQTIHLEGADPIQPKGYWSLIKSREDSEWKIRMLTWNITPAPPAETK
jgi:uncharacterized protein (TIGR02246 family)